MIRVNLLTSGLYTGMSQRPITYSSDNDISTKGSSNTLTIEETNFWSKVNKTESCWLWTGAIKTTGYGVFSHPHAGRYRLISAHRLSWILSNGCIPDRLHVLHKCDVKNCVNPSHLFLGTEADNHQDKAAKGRHWQQKKTHCPKGHAYSPENTYNPPSAPSARQCRTCKGIPLLEVA